MENIQTVSQENDIKLYSQCNSDSSFQSTSKSQTRANYNLLQMDDESTKKGSQQFDTSSKRGNESQQINLSQENLQLLPVNLTESEYRSNSKEPKQRKSVLKRSLKGSRVSFEKTDRDSTDGLNFEERRNEFQQHQTTSVIDNKGILKDLKTILMDENRKAFQSKKHVSLSMKKTVLQDLLTESSSEEDFFKIRKEFQTRKHQSLDSKVPIKTDKFLAEQSSSYSDEDCDEEQKKLIHNRSADDLKPIIIDFDCLDSEDEGLIRSRKRFQQQREISVDSKKSLRFFELNEIGSRKNDNLRNAVPLIRQITEDGKPKLEVYRPTTDKIYIRTQVIK